MKEAYIRLAVLIVLLINQSLLVAGWQPLPFTEEQIYEGFSILALILTTIYTWYKNNNITEEAEKAQEYLNELKSGK